MKIQRLALALNTECGEGVMREKVKEGRMNPYAMDLRSRGAMFSLDAGGA
jgi:hypothetical protein